MVAVVFAVFAVGAYGITRILIPTLKEMLVEAGFVRPNFRQEAIPLGVGLVFFLSAMLILTAGRAFGIFDSSVYTFLFAIGAMGFFGLIDDVFGTRHASGLKGHFKKLFVERELTTGALKALAGGLVALTVSLDFGEGTGLLKWVMVLVNSLIMALATNSINLLDLRPGRAGKGFLVLGVLVILTGSGNLPLLYLAAIGGSLAAFMPLDLKAGAMMGDTGSNMLGMALGYVAVFVMALPVKLAFLLFLLSFHLLTERYSLTRIIENNRVLNYIDMMGRRQ